MPLPPEPAQPVKADTAFRTISEVAQTTGVAQHVLRYWESRFPQLRPLQRAGNRRYYRPADIALVRRIDMLLNQQGYTIKGVQKLLAEDAGQTPAPRVPVVDATPESAPPAGASAEAKSSDNGSPAPDAALLAELRAIRDKLAEALAADVR